MKEELKKSLRTYGALLLLGVTGVPLDRKSTRLNSSHIL